MLSYDLVRLDEPVVFVMLHSVVLKHYTGALCGQRMHICIHQDRCCWLLVNPGVCSVTPLPQTTPC